MVKDRRAGEGGKVKRDELPSAPRTFSLARASERARPSRRCRRAIFTFRDVKVFTRFASPEPFSELDTNRIFSFLPSVSADRWKHVSVIGTRCSEATCANPN